MTMTTITTTLTLSLYTAAEGPHAWLFAWFFGVLQSQLTVIRSLLEIEEERYDGLIASFVREGIVGHVNRVIDN